MTDYFQRPINTERVAQLIAHRACIGVEHDPANGKLHGHCVVCGVPWPCDYAGTPPEATATANPVRVEQREVGGTDYKSDLYKDLAADWPYTIAYLSAAKKDSIESLRGALQDVMRVWGSGLPNPAAPPIQQIEREETK